MEDRDEIRRAQETLEAIKGARRCYDNLKAQGVPEDDPRVDEARKQMDILADQLI